MIVFLPSRTNTAILDDYFADSEWQFTKFDVTDLPPFIETGLSNLSYIDFLILDVTAFSNTPQEILLAVQGFNMMYNRARVIVIDHTGGTQNTLIDGFYRAGFHNIITESETTALYEKLTLALSPRGLLGEDVAHLAYTPIAEEQDEKKVSLFSKVQGKFEKRERKPKKQKKLHKTPPMQTAETEPTEQILETIHEIMSFPSERDSYPIPSDIGVAVSLDEETPPLSEYVTATKEKITTRTPTAIQQIQVESPRSPLGYITPPVRTVETVKTIKSVIQVGVCGINSRIGTTHQAIGIAKYLGSLGLKTALFENNILPVSHKIHEYYSATTNKTVGLISSSGVDFFTDYNPAVVMALGYSIYVTDYGVLTDDSLIQFLSADIKIIVGGSKAWEMSEYQTFFTKISDYPDIQFLLSFTSQNIRDNIRELMGKYKSKTYFASYTPDPFEDTKDFDIYEKLVSDFIISNHVHRGGENER